MPERDVPTLATQLKGLLGGRTAARLAKASLETVADLLRYYPRRHSERGKLTDFAGLRVGEPATIWAQIASIDTRSLTRGKAKHLTKIVVTDGARKVECALFNQPWLGRALRAGMEVMVAGTVSEFRGALQMSSPEIATVDGSVGDVDSAMQLLEMFAEGIIPIYPQTAGVTAGVVQRSVRQVLEVLGPIEDPVPEDLRAAREVIDLDSALRNIHRPRSRELLDQALDRLRYDEALALQLVLARRRARARRRPSESFPRRDDGLLVAFDAALPFELTQGQRAVGDDISTDLAGTYPMNRLLQGEVGSGKTVVALRAMLQVIDAGRQAVLLAPTEVLAAQHARSLRAMLGALGRGGELDAAPGAITITLLTGSLTTVARRQALLDIVAGQPGIVVGTHALLSDDVMFTNLGLVVVDEQHRFGVEQRDTLRDRDAKAHPPHVLVMTATPIPRTVAMTVYGDLDVSTLAELPVGRAGVATTVVPAAEKPTWLDRAWQRIREEVAAGHQAYVVCPKIGADAGDESNESGMSESESVVGRRPPLAVLDVAEYLRTEPLAGLRISVLHGRMPATDKDDVMREFADGHIDVLVATTVIEVGVDVANASVMVIMDAERFGISQLHQLRGRIGRGSVPGVCLLVTEAPAGTTGRARLDAVASTSDGFELAEADLLLRHEGDVLGTDQAGTRSSLKLLSLHSHSELITQARDDAMALVADDPDMATRPGLAAMADAIVATDAQDYLDKA